MISRQSSLRETRTRRLSFDVASCRAAWSQIGDDHGRRVLHKEGKTFDCCGVCISLGRWRCLVSRMQVQAWVCSKWGAPVRGEFVCPRHRIHVTSARVGNFGRCGSGAPALPALPAPPCRSVPASTVSAKLHLAKRPHSFTPHAHWSMPYTPTPSPLSRRHAILALGFRHHSLL